MNDQAENLRNRIMQKNSGHETRTLAVVSGKGGVGKSNFSLNFSISLSQLGKRVLIFDLDIGMGNIEILMGKSAPFSIANFFDGSKKMNEIIVQGTENIHFISGGTGLNQIVNLDSNLIQHFTSTLSEVIEQYDYIVFDMGAGLTKETLSILLSVNDIFVITSTEPTSMMDAYATMKYIHLADTTAAFHLVVNRYNTEKEGTETLNRLQSVLHNFLGKDAIKLGMIPDDKNVQEAVKQQVPFIVFNKKSKAAKAIGDIAKKYVNNTSNCAEKRDKRSFSTRFKQFLFER